MFRRILLGGHLALDSCLLGEVLITALIFLLVMGLFRSTKLEAGSLKELVRSLNHYPDLSKREKTQRNKIMNVRGEITTNTDEIQTILRTCYEQLYATKLCNLGGMNAFLETYKLPQQTGRNRKPEQTQNQQRN